MEPLVIPAPTPARVLGAWMCVIAMFGFVIAFTSGGAALVIGPVWGLAGLTFGIRTVRIRVICDPYALVIRNRFTTRKLPWGDIAKIGWLDRSRTLQWGMTERACGCVTTASGKHLFMDATEMMRYRMQGTMFSQSLEDAKKHVAAIETYWKSANATGGD